MVWKKEVQLKPGEAMPAEPLIGVKYIAAVPLRTYRWRPISDCCRARIHKESIEDHAAIAEGEVIEQDAAKEYCSVCKKTCGKIWTQPSSLIPDLSRVGWDREFQKMDDF